MTSARTGERRRRSPALLIGMTLIAEGFGAHVPKGYLYAAMAFSAVIEGLNMLSRRGKRKANAQANKVS